MQADIERVLITEEAIQRCVGELGRQISADYAGRDPLIIGILKGVTFFMADLLRQIDIPVTVDFMAISKYSPASHSSGAVRILKDLDSSIEGRNVLLVEDIVDTGLTLGYVLRNLRSREPANLEVCTLLNKSVRRLIDLPIAYVGFDLPDEFVVGYGLDYREKYRNLPLICVLKPEIYGY
jgi:hypoxanthine phosphoribosyltransferase